MSDNFNPYSEWLGLPTSETSPSHYQLLGIDKSVCDPDTIANAADRAMTQVRACKPGPHAAAWAELLDQITQAKTTLIDPRQREAYDRQRTGAATPAAAPVDPNLLPPSPTAAPIAVPHSGTSQQPVAQAIDPMDPMAPVTMNSQVPAPQAPQPTQTAAAPQAVPYLQAATPAPAAPDPMAPIAAPVPAAPVPAAPVSPTAPQTLANPMAPVSEVVPAARAIPVAPAPPAAAQPTAMPVAGPMLAAQPVAAAQPLVAAATPNVERKASTVGRRPAKSSRKLGPIVLGGGVGSLIVAIVGIAFYLSKSRPDPAPPSVEVASNLPRDGGAGEVASTIPRRLDEIPESERPQPERFVLPTESTVEEPLGTPPPAQPMSEPETVVVAPTMTPEPSPAMPEPASDAKPTREELEALGSALTAARRAIGELNFPVVDREIAKALKLAKLDDHKEKIRRLQMLSDYVGRFRAAIDETLGQVDAGDQISLSENRSFGIVEVTPDQIIIRFGGKNLPYPLNEMPLGLSARLAEMSLDETAPETIAMKAAFVSVNPKVSDRDLDKVSTWWEEAASVSDVQDLIIAINDDYSLKEDMGVPLDPSAVAVLSAHADRLKDARTIDEFAKEYQVAIDESLKTLEPDDELSVGGSTTVTIKELKANRVMLVVAEETRGFQRTKLPLGLAASIAERILPRDAPLVMVMKGAYFAARDREQANKQFRPMVFDWWKQAGEMDQQLQPVIRELAKQYPG